MFTCKEMWTLYYVYHALINKSSPFLLRHFLLKAVVMALNFLFSKILRQQSDKKIQLPRRHREISHDRVGNLKLWLQKLNNACPLFITTKRTYTSSILYTINRKINTAPGEYFSFVSDDKQRESPVEIELSFANISSFFSSANHEITLNEVFKPYFLFIQKIRKRSSTKYASQAVTLKFIKPNNKSMTKCISSVIKCFRMSFFSSTRAKYIIISTQIAPEPTSTVHNTLYP